MRDETLLEMTGSVEQVIFRNEKNIDSSDCMRLFNRVQRM